MYWNLLPLRRLLLLLTLLGGSAIASIQTGSAQTLALSSPTPNGVHNDEPKQKQAVALITVLEQLEKQHDVRFNYASQLVKDQAVQENVADAEADLEKALTQLLKPLGLRHEKVSQQIYGIYRVPQPAKVSKTPASERTSLREAQVDLIARLGLRPLQTVAVADQNISGTVTDENGDGLPGVNVLAKNTTIGTVTDIEGNYRLSIPDNAETLVFSSVGYLTQEVAINNRTTR